MNKQQIIAPLVAMGIVFIIGFIVLPNHRHRDYLQMRAMGIGRDLIHETNSSAVVRLGPALSNELVKLHAAPISVYRVRLGDFTPSSSQAKVCVYLTNETGTCIGIRLRPDKDSDRFHIVGYWTESRPAQ